MDDRYATVGLNGNAVENLVGAAIAIAITIEIDLLQIECILECRWVPSLTPAFPYMICEGILNFHMRAIVDQQEDVSMELESGSLDGAIVSPAA